MAVLKVNITMRTKVKLKGLPQPAAQLQNQVESPLLWHVHVYLINSLISPPVTTKHFTCVSTVTRPSLHV